MIEMNIDISFRRFRGFKSFPENFLENLENSGKFCGFFGKWNREVVV